MSKSEILGATKTIRKGKRSERKRKQTPQTKPKQTPQTKPKQTPQTKPKPILAWTESPKSQIPEHTQSPQQEYALTEKYCPSDIGIDALTMTYIDSLHDFIAEKERSPSVKPFRDAVFELIYLTPLKKQKIDKTFWIKLFEKIYPTYTSKYLRQYLSFASSSPNTFLLLISKIQETLIDSTITIEQCHILNDTKINLNLIGGAITRSASQSSNVFDKLKQFMLWHTIIRKQRENKITLMPIRKRDFSSTIGFIKNYRQTVNQGNSLRNPAGAIQIEFNEKICNTSAQYLDPNGATYKDADLFIYTTKDEREKPNKAYYKFEQICFNHPSGIKFVINTCIFNRSILLKSKITKTEDILKLNSSQHSKYVLHELEIQYNNNNEEKEYVHVHDRGFLYPEEYIEYVKNKIVLNSTTPYKGISVGQLCDYFNNIYNKDPKSKKYYFEILKRIFAIKNCGDLLQFLLSKKINTKSTNTEKVYVHTKDILAAACAIAHDCPVVFHSSGTLLFIQEYGQLQNEYRRSLQGKTYQNIKRISAIFNYLNNPKKRMLILKSGLQTYIQNLKRLDTANKSNNLTNPLKAYNNTNQNGQILEPISNNQAIQINKEKISNKRVLPPKLQFKQISRKTPSE